MMNIWIVDDDISFAYGLKEKLKAEDRTIEVFTDSDSFLEFLQKKKKDKADLPQLIFLEVEFSGKNGIEVYLEFYQNKDPLAQNIFFCSNISFGRFEQFFLDRKIPTPPFIQKSRLEKEIDKIIEQYFEDDEKPKKDQTRVSSVPQHVRNRCLKDVESKLDEMKGLYYESKVNKENLQQFKALTAGFIGSAKQLGLVKSVQRAEKAMALFERQVQPGLIRLKKEIKELMSIIEKDYEAIKN